MQSSLLTEMELMWYACALENILLGTASMVMSFDVRWGTRSRVMLDWSRGRPSLSTRFHPLKLRHLSVIFHSLIVLSAHGQIE